ncbi:hypothetical protein TIFTF001_035644 [Ficus carica]|uniref:Uncharacterized protein n=1 Tax=Ficus carica TaxID=3494 RepID=A0AA88E2M3_FICCA|nr:hypothetical protein TIFTF001_035644 [Ficus carica]
MGSPSFHLSFSIKDPLGTKLSFFSDLKLFDSIASWIAARAFAKSCSTLSELLFFCSSTSSQNFD